MAGNRLAPSMSAFPSQDGMNALAPQPSWADAYDNTTSTVGDYIAQQRAQAVAQGLLDPDTGMPTKAGMKAAGMAYAFGMTDGGPSMMPKIARSLPNSVLESRIVGYNPPVMPQRAIAADYPNGVPADGTGRITADIEGRPLTAPVIAGRSTMAQDGSFPDRGVDMDAIRSVGQGAGGASFLGTAQRNLGSKTVGEFQPGWDPITNERAAIIRTSNELTPSQNNIVQGHEVGHLVDWVANGSKGIDHQGLSEELGGIYNQLNNQSASPNVGLPTTPQSFKYSAADAPGERMAEAIRAYMVNPNYLKSVAPDTAARIREYVNNNKQISKYIQFNSAVGAGGLAGSNLLNPQQGAPMNGQ